MKTAHIFSNFPTLQLFSHEILNFSFRHQQYYVGSTLDKKVVLLSWQVRILVFLTFKVYLNV